MNGFYYCLGKRKYSPSALYYSYQVISVLLLLISPASYLFYASHPVSVALLLCSPLPGLSAPPHPSQSQPEWIRPHNPALNLERWYQDIMSAGEPHHQSCPPPLPAKSHSSRRPSQVNLSPLFALIYYAICSILYFIS